MIWFNFSVCQPSASWVAEIVICNYFTDDDGRVRFRFVVCPAREYKSVLGLSNMMEKNTFWMPLDLPKCPIKEKLSDCTPATFYRNADGTYSPFVAVGCGCGNGLCDIDHPIKETK